jgi:hypothetical protein
VAPKANPKVNRVFRFWRRKSEREDGTATYPLCRIRHATLHPGAALWTPGTSGGNFGGGAEAAITAVGIGGVVAVGFQTTARELVHPCGVLARVEARAPFPDGQDPTGLGASDRWRLVGLSRVSLDPETCANRKHPTISAAPAQARLEDFADAPEPLVAVLTALANLQNDWPAHWLEAFRTLPGQPLGQWATSLGWRLAAEERIALFEHPARIADTLLQALESLHLGLAPERRREALRAQTLTRRTTVMPHRWMAVEADESGWALFHPSDLAPALTATAPHEVHATTGANGEAANTLRSAGAGRGRTIVLLTHAGLPLPLRSVGAATPPADGADGPAQRRPLLTPSEGFPAPVQRILVRHGRLFLGPAGLVQGGQPDRLEYLQGEQWVDIPNGLFRIAVVPIPADALDAWLRAFPDQRDDPPAELLTPARRDLAGVFAAIFEPVDMAEADPAGEDLPG